MFTKYLFLNYTCEVSDPSKYVVAMESQTPLAVRKRMKFPTSEGSIELINHPFTMVFSVCHLRNVESVSDGRGNDLSIYPRLSLHEMYTS